MAGFIAVMLIVVQYKINNRKVTTITVIIAMIVVEIELRIDLLSMGVSNRASHDLHWNKPDDPS